MAITAVSERRPMLLGRSNLLQNCLEISRMKLLNAASIRKRSLKKANENNVF
jgi:hypothetical protein